MLIEQFEGNCPRCQTSQLFTYYQSVNVTLYPETKEKVLSGEIFLHTCNTCNKTLELPIGFLYHDMEINLMIWLAMSEEELESVENNKKIINLGKGLRKIGYINRTVLGFNALLEKIFVFDSGLNDLVVDEIKNKVESSMRVFFAEKGEERDFEVFFKKLNIEEGNSSISFVIITETEENLSIKFDINMLDEAQRARLFDLDELREN